jgi:hypothetical protein
VRQQTEATGVAEGVQGRDEYPAKQSLRKRS